MSIEKTRWSMRRVLSTRPIPILARALTALGCSLVLATAARADFPPQGVDTFPSAAPISVTIGRCTTSNTPCLNNVADCPLGGLEACALTIYGNLGTTDPATVASRSAVIGEGTAGDGGGTPVLTPGCANCAGAVSDADLTCWPAPPPNWEANANSREVHTEMLSLQLCGTCTLGPCIQICYLAGQPAFNALAAVGAGASYRNSFGEVERLNPGTNPPGDFPATSFWDVKGVVTINPAPAGTSGVFVLDNPAESILMVSRNIPALPPPAGIGYDPEAGTTAPGGAGVPCGVLPLAVRDPVANARAGEINNGVRHILGSTIPLLGTGGLIVMVLLTVGIAIIVIVRGRLAPGV